MKIKVEVKNDVLGDSVFWQGSSDKISEIRNIPARKLAEAVSKDGICRVLGMWVVSKMED